MGFPTKVHLIKRKASEGPLYSPAEALICRGHQAARMLRGRAGLPSAQRNTLQRQFREQAAVDDE